MKTKNLKTVKTIFTLVILFIIQSGLNAQESGNLPTAAVFNIQVSSGLPYTGAEIGRMTRYEAGKLGKYFVFDLFDINEVLEQNQIQLNDCYSKECLLRIGKLAKADKVICGNFTYFSKEKVVFTFRVMDVQSGLTEKSIVKEFRYINNQIPEMIEITLKEMHGLEYDKDLEKLLTDKHAYENTINNPERDILNCSGTRMGLTYVSGAAAKDLSRSTKQGGYDVYPLFFQFGYQFEVQYLNEGNFQALFEFVPMIGGIEQGIVIPSLTIMNGLRNSKNGLEFAFGPTVNLSKMAYGYTIDGKWYLSNELEDWQKENLDRELKVDSRGKYRLNPGFMFAVGKTFKSGNLNIPVNMYVIPRKEGLRLGVSFGYNSKK